MSVKSVLHLGRTMRLVWSIAPGWTLASIALAVVQGVLPLASAYMIGYIVDAVAAGVTATDKDAAFAHVAWLIFIAGLIGLAAALARSLAALVTEAQGQVITDHISDLIHAKSIAVDLEYYENSKYYDVLHRAQQEAPYRPARIVSDLMTVGQSTITVIGVIGMIFSLNWLVGVIVVAAALPERLRALPLLEPHVPVAASEHGRGSAVVVPAHAADRRHVREGAAALPSRATRCATGSTGCATCCAASACRSPRGARSPTSPARRSPRWRSSALSRTSPGGRSRAPSLWAT